MLGNIARVKSTNRACEVGTIPKGNIPGADQNNRCHWISCPDMWKNIPKRT